MRKLLFVAAAFAAALATAASATAQGYPSRPITMIVPFAAGGPLDVMARILADRMRAPLGQPVIIEEVGGAAGSIGVGRARGRRPTATPSCWAPGAPMSATARSITLNYDLLADFEPIVIHLDHGADHRRPEVAAGRRSEGPDRLAQGQSRQGDAKAPPAWAARRTSPAPISSR